MKKLFITLVSLFAFAAVTVTSVSCTSTAIVKNAAVASTTIESVDKYGNAILTLTVEDFKASGFDAGDIALVTAGSYSYEAPVCKNISDVDNGKPLVFLSVERVCLIVNMGSFAKISGAASDTPVTFTLKAKGAYLKDSEVRQLKKSENRNDYESDEAFANFRSVKAGKIAKDRLYRSYNPAHNDIRAPFADSLVEKAGIKVIVNLADSYESASAGFDKAPYYAAASKNGNVMFLDMGVSYTDEDFILKLNKGLSFMAQHSEGPYLVHCNEGKDRAGFVIAVLEAVNGATLDEMIADYMLSFENLYGIKKGTDQYNTIGQTVADHFKRLNGGKAVKEKDLAKIAENYLIKTVGLTQNQLNTLKANLQ